LFKRTAVLFRWTNDHCSSYITSITWSALAAGADLTLRRTFSGMAIEIWAMAAAAFWKCDA
jgi:hypothetical protein